MKTINIGTAKSEPGKLTFGYIDSIDFPTGTPEKLPVMIAQGKEEGPTLFLTANIHGTELTGIAVIHELVTESLAQKIKGSIVAIPSLNPSGLRGLQRSPDFDTKDPNRTFPRGIFEKEKESKEEDDDEKYPKLYEQVAEKIFSYIEKYADYLIDFHNHTVGSHPYAIIDRIFYKDEEQKENAEQLLQKQKELVEAFGITTCEEFPAEKYMRLKYYRTLSGATLNTLRIPAITVELGSNTVLIPQIVAGSIKATRNVLKCIGILEGEREEITEFPIIKPDKRIRRCEHPRAKHSGIIKFLVEPGEEVKKGQPIARITDIFGRPLGDGIIKTEHDGYIIALKSGMTVFANETIAEMGIKDELPLINPIPEK